jgi:monoamine oxidase
MSPDERKRLLTDRYAKYFKCPELLNPVHYVEKNWAEEEYSGGCYVGCLPPGVLTQYGEEIRRPFHRVYFAGTETATYWVGYMEGAVQSGERAAREILHAMGRIPDSEIWQQEPPAPDFQEIPMEPRWIQRLLPSPKTFLVGLATVAVGVTSVVIHRFDLIGRVNLIDRLKIH